MQIVQITKCKVILFFVQHNPQSKGVLWEIFLSKGANTIHINAWLP